MKVKINNKKVLIVLLIILLLIIAVGYAVFSETLTIQGTANAKGTFDLEFQNAEIVKNIGANEEKTTAEISADKNTLTVNVADLEYPGAGVEFSVDIVNVGTMPAEVHAVTPNNITGSDKIKVTGLEGIKVGHPKIEVGDRCNIHFTVEWPYDSGEILEDESSISFGLQIEYTQSTGEAFDGQASHTDGEQVPEYTVPTGITSTYGKTLADIKLPEGFRFQDPLDTPIGNAGTNIFKVIYTSEDGREVRDIEMSIEIEKATPEYTTPTEITATYGKTLADIKLPEGFKFQDSLETPVGNVGTNNFKVTYTPLDTNNYNEIQDIEVSIVVSYEALVNIITAEDYGKSINYVATVSNQKISNWKVLYNDKRYIYLLLDDFLPNTLVPSKTGLSKSKTYNVYSNTSSDALLKALETESYWSEFANGVSGAAARGGASLEELISSYNEKYGTNFVKNDMLTGVALNSTDKLYVPHQVAQNGTYFYWLTNKSTTYSTNVFGILLQAYSNYKCGGVHTNPYNRNDSIGVGVRPMVKLPSTVLGIVGEKVEIK